MNELQRSYWCFISYRHADNKQPGRQWATWLHQAIETYEVPEDLVGKTNERGDTIPERIFPVFRDEEELPVDADLASPIYRALDSSKFLVVICSPRAVASTYVDSEIKYFKQTGRGDRVLAVMIEGEPNASWDIGKQAHGFNPEDECFPQAMRHQVAKDGMLLDERTEPIAADFRLGTAQGWTSPEAYRLALQKDGLDHKTIEVQLEVFRRQSELMKLKVIAGILGVPLGTLTERDKAYRLAIAQKRARALRRWLAAVGLLALLAVLGAGVAYFQKKEADRQKAEAIAEKEQALETFARSDFLQAEALIKADKLSEAFAYLARSLRTQPRNNSASLLAFSYLPLQPMPLTVFPSQRGLRSASFSNDGTRVVTVSDGGLAQVWSVETGQPVSPPLKHADSILFAKFSPDGMRVATGSQDKTARIWNAVTGQPLSPPLPHDGMVTSGTFSPDGTRLVTTSYNSSHGALGGEARIWDAQTGQPLSPPLHDGLIKFTAGSIAVVAYLDDKTGRIMDANSGQPLTPQLSPLPPSPPPTTTQVPGFDLGWRLAGLSADGKLLLLDAIKEGGQGLECGVWDVKTGSRLALFGRGDLRGVGFNPDGTRILTTSIDKTVNILDARTGQPLTQYPGGTGFPQFSPDGSRLVVSGGEMTRVWDATTGHPLTPPFQHQFGGTYASFSPDGSRIVTVSDTLQIWRAQSWPALPLRLPVTSGSFTEFSPDGRGIVTASEDGSARAWDVASGLPLTPVMWHVVKFSTNPLAVPPQPLSGWIISARYSPDGTRLVTASWDYTARVWDARTGEPITPPLQHGGIVDSARFSPDGTRVVTVSEDGSARVWDARTGLPLTSPIQKPGAAFRSASYSPDGTMLVTISSGASGTVVQVWDAMSGQAIGSNIPIPNDPFPLATFSPDSKLLVVASGSSAEVWEARTGRPLTPPLAHAAKVIRAGFSSDGTRVFTVAQDKIARLWDVQTGAVVPFTREAADDGLTSHLWDPQSGQPLTPPWVSDSDFFLASISPDKLHLAQGNLIQDLAPESEPPGWLPAVLEAVASQALDATGGLRPCSMEELKRIRNERLASTSTDPWEVFGRWLFSDPRTRTISPWSSVRLPEYVDRLIQENTTESLDQARTLSYGQEDIEARIVAQRALLPPSRNH